MQPDRTVVDGFSVAEIIFADVPAADVAFFGVDLADDFYVSVFVDVEVLGVYGKLAAGFDAHFAAGLYFDLGVRFFCACLDLDQSVCRL